MTDPTPATPDEAVAPMVDLLRAEFDQGHMMVMEPIAERVLALSRQQGDTVAARVGRLVSLGYWVSVGRAYDVPVRACVFSEEEDADATADGPTIEAALRDLVAYVERPCVCGHAWASHQPEYDYPVWASHCTHPADDGCGRWEDPEPRREPIPVAPGQVDMGIGADGAGDGR